ncbi:hypothetical protein GGR53DRAFT_471605 [Hypoxylon sp. FL1150]|nr:hypothetical protein GGR53DRAFT_471605 [Hypoxylon sp. FL1150]
MPNSQPPPQRAAWHEVVLRQKYNDPTRLKASLDSIYGPGRYIVKIKANRYYLQLPEPLLEVNRPVILSEPRNDDAETFYSL